MKIERMTAEGCAEGGAAGTARVFRTVVGKQLGREPKTAGVFVSGGEGERCGGGLCRNVSGSGRGEYHQRGGCPDFWKQGIGNTLVKTLICEAAKRHIREMTLEVRVSNRAAIRLYERNGFVSEGCRKNYYDKPKEDALIMWNRAIQ